MVSIPCSRSDTNSSLTDAHRARAKSVIGIDFPNVRLNCSEPENRNGSWKTIAEPPSDTCTEPSCAPIKPAINFNRVDLPDPVSPTTATVDPTGTEKLTLEKMGTAASAYENFAFVTLTANRESDDNVWTTGCSSNGSSSISLTRLNPLDECGISLNK